MATAEEAGRTFCEHLGFVYRVALSAARDAAEAEEVVQDAFVRFAASFASFDPSRPAEPYLARAVMNVAANRARTERRRAEHHQALRREADMGTASPTYSQEDLAALASALGELDLRTRMAVSLRYLERLPLEDAAAALEVSPSTASEIVGRGLDRLRRTLSAAGLGALAAPAALAALPRPDAPAGLKATLAKLAAGKEMAFSSAAPAAKGGLIVKIGLGATALGLAAGGVLWAAGVNSGEPAKPAAVAGEHAEDARYRFEPIVGARRADKGGMYGAVMGRGILNGPGLASDFCDCDDMDVDDAGNVYWTESGAFNILRKWDRATNIVTTLAGSVCGHLDGPAESARFGDWGGGGYSGSNLQVSGDGKHAFLGDNAQYGNLRHVDLEKGMVTTLGKCMAAKEKSGEIYVISRDGTDVPAGEGYKTLKTPKLDHAGGTGFWAALDLDGKRLYAHGRGNVYYWELATGKVVSLTWSDYRKPGARETDTSGPLETSNFQCPIGIAISPGGRFLYVGGGDSSSFWRLDLEKKYVKIFSRDDAGICSFQDGKEFTKATSFAKWPSVARFSPDGSAAWSSPAGIFRLTPVK